MESAFLYFLKSFISSGLLLIYYLVALRNGKFHSFNRIYLLTSMGISVAGPLINFSRLFSKPAVWLLPGKPVYISARALTGVTAPVLQTVIIICYGLIAVVLLTIMICQIAWIYRVRRNHSNLRMDGFYFIQTELKQAPFTFLNNLFWKKSISLDDLNGSKIFRHEVAHIKGKHTYDKLFSQMVVCLFWINPFYRIIKNELNIIHEYIADAKSIEDGNPASLAQMLLESRNETGYLTPIHSYFYSPIKRRLNMITNTRKTRYGFLRRIMALPIILLVTGIILITTSRAQKTSQSGQPIPGRDMQNGLKIKLSSELYPEPFSLEENAEMSRLNSKGISKQSLDLVYYLNGSLSSGSEIKKLDPAQISSMRISKGKSAEERYSKVGKDGAVEFFTK